jgi:hypothetical protein
VRRNRLRGSGMSQNRRHLVKLTNDPNETQIEITSWRIEGGWLTFTEERGNVVKTTLIPTSWPTPIGITTIYEGES